MPKARAFFAMRSDAVVGASPVALPEEAKGRYRSKHRCKAYRPLSLIGLRSKLVVAEVEGFVEFSFSEPSASRVIRCVISLEKKSSTLYADGTEKNKQGVRIEDM